MRENTDWSYAQDLGTQGRMELRESLDPLKHLGVNFDDTTILGGSSHLVSGL